MSGSHNAQSGNCGACGETIRPDHITGTTCACARRGPVLPDATPLPGLLAQRERIDLAAAIRDKFNEVSERNGFPERL